MEANSFFIHNCWVIDDFLTKSGMQFTTHAFAIKRFFNCMTDVADKYRKLSIDDVNLCYDKEYHSGQYATHHSGGADNSSSGGSSSSSG